MSQWVQVTGSFYIHSWQNNIGKRLESFMRDNFRRIPDGSEGALDWGVMQSTEHITGWDDEQGGDIYGCGQLHIFGSLRDMTVDIFEEGLLDFLEKLQRAFPVRAGQVIVDGYSTGRKIYWLNDNRKNPKVHIVDVSDEKQNKKAEV